MAALTVDFRKHSGPTLADDMAPQGTAVQSLTRLPVMTEAVGRAVSIETETINRNMDSIMEKLTALQRKIDNIRDQNGQRE